FGDGAVNRGPLLEALNWAVVYKLPVLFVCEDNQYTAAARTAEFTGGEGIVARGRSFGLGCEPVDGNDALAVHDLAEKLVGRLRRGEGPALIHALAYRGHGHFANDNGVYRDEEAQKKALAGEPIERCRTWLAMQGSSRPALDTTFPHCALTRTTVGAVMCRARPVLELHRADRCLCAADKIVKPATKKLYTLNVQARVATAIRQPIGIQTGLAAQHSQSSEA